MWVLLVQYHTTVPLQRSPHPGGLLLWQNNICVLDFVHNGWWSPEPQFYLNWGLFHSCHENGGNEQRVAIVARVCDLFVELLHLSTAHPWCTFVFGAHHLAHLVGTLTTVSSKPFELLFRLWFLTTSCPQDSMNHTVSAEMMIDTLVGDPIFPALFISHRSKPFPLFTSHVWTLCALQGV